MTLQEQLALALANAKSAYEAGNIEEGDRHKGDVEKFSRAIKSLETISGIEQDSTKSLRPTLPNTQPAPTPAPTQPADSAANKAVYTMRFGEDSAAKSAVLTDLVGGNYRQIIWDQNAAFAKFLRGGENALERDEFKLLKSQVFAFEDIEAMVKNGYSVTEIKSTMVEAQGTLGGFAVPSTMQSEIIRRLPGLTAVRGGGATVVNLTTGNSVEYVEVTGSGDRYTSILRGAWGSETQSPTEKNFTLGLKTITADIYTYKVPMSQSLVEDASNLVTILQDEAGMTMAMDEDDAFLIGDGVGKPQGIMPSSANSLGLAYAVSGHASLITSDGMKRLKRAIPAQYRNGASFVANSDTLLAIELLVDGNGNYLYEDMTENPTLLARRVSESEALPDIAANAFPAIYGNMAGYYIVERSGMTIARYQDSNTGINKVEYHFRRRVGGRVVKPWMFSLLKIAAS